MSFIFIISDSNSTPQQCELVFEEQPGFTLLTQSTHKKHIRAGIKNTQYLSQVEREQLQTALEAGVPLWFRQREIKQYCRIYLSRKMTQYPINCKRFATKTPQHARLFDDSFYTHDFLEEGNILIQLFKMSQENYALIETAIGPNKTLRYSINDYQHGQKLPKNAMLLMEYPEEVQRKAGEDYKAYKHRELIKQIPGAAIDLVWALGSAIKRHPVATVVIILGLCLLGTAAASAIANNPVNNKDAPEDPAKPATDVKPFDYFPAQAMQQADTAELFFLETTGRPPNYASLEEEGAFARRVEAVRNNFLKNNPVTLFVNYLLYGQYAHAHVMLQEKRIDLHHGAPGGASILAYITTLTTIKTEKKLNIISKLITMGSSINPEDRLINPLFIATRLNDLTLVKFFVENGGKTIIQNGNLLSEAIRANANNVYDWLIANDLVNVNKKITFSPSVSMEEKALRVPCLAALLNNNVMLIRKLVARKQLNISTLDFYFDDLFLVSFTYSERFYNALSLIHLLHTGSDNTYEKLDLFVKKHSDSLDTMKVEVFIYECKKKDIQIKRYFKQKDVRNMRIALQDLLTEARFDYVKNLMKEANIHINDKIGAHPLLTYIVINQSIRADIKLRICMKLIDWKAEINREDLSNPLMHAVQQDDLPLVTFFQLEGGKLITQNHHALYWAIKSDARQVMDNLLVHKFKINQIVKIIGDTDTPILAIAKSKDRHILQKLIKKYGLHPDTLLYYLEYIVYDALAFEDAERWLLDLFKVFETSVEWAIRLSEMKANLENDPGFSRPQLVKLNKIIDNYLKTLKAKSVENSIPQPLPGKIVSQHKNQPQAAIPVEMPTQPVSFWKQYSGSAVFYIDVAVLAIGFGSLCVWLAYQFWPVNNADNAQGNTAKNDLEKMVEKVESLMSHLKAIEPVYRNIVDTSKPFFPPEESAWKDSLEIKLTLTEEEKRLYGQITIAPETRTWVVEKLGGFLKEIPKNPEEQGRMLRRDIIMRSPEYLQVIANDRLVNEMTPYLQLVQLHQNQKPGFERAFSEIRIKNSFPPILSKQQTILDKLKQYEQRINVHETFLKLFSADLDALIQTIQKNTLGKYDDARAPVIYRGLNAIVKEREAIREWCNNQGVTVEKIKIKSIPLEVKKPVSHAKSRNLSIPQIPRESVDNKPVPIQNPVSLIPKTFILSREIDYTAKQGTIDGEPKKPLGIKDGRIFYILHLMDLMRDTIKETHPDVQRHAARQLLSKCFGTIHTFCDYHVLAIQDVFPWWKSTKYLRNGVLHNKVLWSQQDPQLLLEEFINTFEKPFNAFKNQGFYSKPIETKTLKNLCLFLPSSRPNEMEKMILPDAVETTQRLISLCHIMHEYYGMAEEAVQKQLFECDGKLHAAMACCVLEMRDYFRDLLTLKNNEMFSGPQFLRQRKRCTLLIRVMNKKIMHYDAKEVNIIDLANYIAHETNDFKDNEVSRKFHNGYQFRFEDQLYYVQEPVPYLTLHELFKELDQGDHLSLMLQFMDQDPLPRIKHSVPLDLKLSFAPD